MRLLPAITKTIFFISLPIWLNACGGGGGGGGDDENGGADQSVVIDDNNPPVVSNVIIPPLSTRWQWQLSGTVNTSYDVELFDIDLFDAADKISELQGLGKIVICYFSAGSSEDWRDDFSDFDAADMGNTLDGFPDEKWLDVRNDNVRTIMQARIARASTQGCDGVEPDNMDGYQNNPGFDYTANDQLDFNRFIANEAHTLDLLVGLKNDLDQVCKLVEYFDFAVNEQCFQFNECGVYSLFTDRNKPVFNAEYPEEDISLIDVANQDSLCQMARAINIRTLIMPLDLDDSSRFSCD